MAAFAAITAGNLAGILSGDAIETGAAVIGQRLYNYGYRKRHPLDRSYPSAKRVQQSYGIVPRKRKRSKSMSEVTPRGRSRSFDHHMSDPSHGTGESQSTVELREQDIRVGKLYVDRVELPFQGTNVNQPENNYMIKGIKIHHEWHGKFSDNSTSVSATPTGHMGPCVIN